MPRRYQAVAHSLIRQPSGVLDNEIWLRTPRSGATVRAPAGPLTVYPERSITAVSWAVDPVEDVMRALRTVNASWEYRMPAARARARSLASDRPAGDPMTRADLRSAASPLIHASARARTTPCNSFTGEDANDELESGFGPVAVDGGAGLVGRLVGAPWPRSDFLTTGATPDAVRIWSTTARTGTLSAGLPPTSISPPATNPTKVAAALATATARVRHHAGVPRVAALCRPRGASTPGRAAPSRLASSRILRVSWVPRSAGSASTTPRRPVDPCTGAGSAGASCHRERANSSGVGRADGVWDRQDITRSRISCVRVGATSARCGRSAAGSGAVPTRAVQAIAPSEYASPAGVSGRPASTSGAAHLSVAHRGMSSCPASWENPRSAISGLPS